MTADKLYGTLKFIEQLDSQLALQSGLEAIRDTLDTLVSSPAQPQQQKALASALEGFLNSANKLASAIDSFRATAIAEMGGEEFFDSGIAEKIRASVSTNAMTPSVARDFVRDIATRRASFLETVTNTIRGLESLKLSLRALPAGQADLAFLIPRDLFQNRLAEFSKELGFISRLVQHISEGLTGKPEPVELESLSSSTPTITLGASLAVVAALATIVNKFLEAWERIQKIRRLRHELAEIGLKGAAVDELTEQVTTTIEEIVEESTQLVLVKYNGHKQGRKNELENAVRTDVRRLFGQIERGLTIEFHAEPKTDSEGDDKRALDTLVQLGRNLRFPDPAQEPLLLTSNEVLEGEIRRKVTTKTSTQKTTTVKKTSTKDPKADEDDE